MKPYIPVSKRIRVASIIQLCLVFSYLLWIGGYPFTGDLYHIRSQKLVYESVMSNPNFHSIPLSDQKNVIYGYKQLQSKQSSPFLTKLSDSFKIIFLYISPFLRVWAVLSLLIPIFLLYNVEGASAISWLLPIVILFAIGDGKSELTHEMKLFPSEKMLVSKYSDQSLSQNIFNEQKRLKEAWNNYLIDQWSDHDLSHGELNFNLARIEAIERDGFPTSKENFNGKTSPLIGVINLIWSLIFAYLVTFKTSSKNKIRVP